jgi:rhodanese-related sulfurtransferase
MDVKDFSEKIAQAEVIILDVRTPEEFAEGYIEGAKNIDFYHADFESQITSLAKDVTYAIYCRSGKRSSQAMEIMQEFGFENLYNLEGGIIEWTNTGMPVVSS